VGSGRFCYFALLFKITLLLKIAKLAGWTVSAQVTVREGVFVV
jgi:hypothetical protein